MTNLVFDEFIKNHLETTTKKLLTLTDDPITLSCASWREYRTSGQLFQSLQSSDLQVIEEDRVLAGKIKDYYSKKIFVKKLKNQWVSEFQNKLGEYLAGTYELVDKDLGAIYRLPYFYAEDQEIDNIIHETIAVPDSADIFQTDVTITLTPLKKIYRGRKHNETTLFVFKTDKGYASVLSINNNNTLFKLVDGLFRRDSVKLLTSLTVADKLIYGHRYYHLSSIQLA